jgi:hypothetical protein
MEHHLSNQSQAQPADPPPSTGARAEELRCAICERRLHATLVYLEETGGDIPEPHRSWLLCASCNEAVHEQLQRAPVRSPLRLRVAVGLVAAERTPTARRERFGQLSDLSWERLLFWSFIIAFMLHLAVMVFVAELVAHH